MKTKLKIMLIMLMIIMLITVFTTSVKAEYSAIVTMTPDKTEVNPGDTISVVVNLEDVVDAGTGASEMAGYVEYDSNFIESISSTQGTWATNPETGMFLLSGNILTEDGQFAVLQFKVSENATGSSSVTFTQIITSDGTAEPSSPDITLTFTVADPEDPSNPEDPNNPEDPSNIQVIQKIQTIQRIQVIQKTQVIQKIQVIQRIQIIQKNQEMIIQQEEII